MLQNAYFLAKIGADTAENEQHFADILLKTGNYPTGPTGRGALGPAGPAAVLVRPRARPRPGPRERSSRNLGDSAPQSYETNVMNH